MSLASLLVSAGIIKNETALRANTATRIGSMFEDVINALPLSHQVTLTQAQVRTLNTANGGLGFELLPTLEAGKAYQISNVFFAYNLTGGAVVNSKVFIYNENISNSFAAFYISGTSTIGKYFKQVPNTKDIDVLETDGVYLWSEAEHSTFEGNAIISFDYKIIDLN